jgi:hypothetical protein
MNRAPAKETKYLREKVHDNNKLPINYENLEPSSIQSTQEELKKLNEKCNFQETMNSLEQRTQYPLQARSSQLHVYTRNDR